MKKPIFFYIKVISKYLSRDFIIKIKIIGNNCLKFIYSIYYNKSFVETIFIILPKLYYHL